MICSLRYEWWRWTSPLPEGQEVLQQVWAWIFLIFETATIFGNIATYVFMSRVRDRSREVLAADLGALYCRRTKGKDAKGK